MNNRTPPARPCRCPADAQATSGDLVVTGHTPTCPNRGPRRYLFTVAGEEHIGTLADYARHWEQALLGDLTSLSNHLISGDAVYRVEVKDGGVDHEGWRHIALTVEHETVLLAIAASDDLADAPTDAFCWVCGDEGHLPRPSCLDT